MTRGGRGRGGDGKGGGGGAEDERYLGRLRQYLGSLGDKRAKQHQKFGFVTIIPRGGPEEQQVEREDAIMHWEEFFLLLERCGGTVESGQLVSFHLREHTKGGGPSGNIKKKATCIYPEYEPAFHGTLPPDEINESGKVYQYSFMRFGEHNENFDSVVTEFQVNPAIPRKRELGTNGSLHWGTFTLARQIPPPVGGAGGPPMGPPPPVQPNWNDAANWCYNLQQQQAFVHYQQQQQLAYAQQQAMAPHPQFYSQACPMISPAPSSVAGQPSPPGPVPIHPNAGPDGGAESFAVRAQRACHQLFNNKENVAPRPKAMSAMSEAPPPKAAASSSLKALFVKEGGPDGVEDTPRDRTGSSNSVLPVPGASSTRRGNTSKESSDKKSGADREEVDLYKDLGVGSDTAKKKKAGERAAASDKSGGGDGKSRRKRSDSPNRSPNSPKCRKEDCGRPTRAQPPGQAEQEREWCRCLRQRIRTRLFR
ncbi:unnamed protein product [Amoebophrya sp. A25]|nr:unnamed protein product [Amoebophrya sp. A25]|eukprot:GSA25T00011987001.1